jgi:hypothetical protein
MRPVLRLAEERAVLHKFKWETCEGLEGKGSDPGSPRFTFDHGGLGVLSPSAEHRRHTRRIAIC